jgi:hypothetical protein
LRAVRKFSRPNKKQLWLRHKPAAMGISRENSKRRRISCSDRLGLIERPNKALA